jgi:protein-disulfide isomerase
MTAFPFRRVACFLAVSAATAMAASAGRAETPAAAGALSAAQQQQVKEVIRSYLMENPELILDAVKVYQARQEAKAKEEARNALVSNRDKLESDKDTPFAGNPKGDVTIVEFFDYNCGYCKKMIPAIQDVLKTDKNVRFVFKELPILREDSARAATAALAVWKIAPDKYLDYHVALMSGRGEFTDDRLFKAAETLGIDKEKLKTAMADPAIEQSIRRNRELSHMLGINGTPAFIIGDEMLPGAIEADVIRDAIKKKRAS